MAARLLPRLSFDGPSIGSTSPCSPASPRSPRAVQQAGARPSPIYKRTDPVPGFLAGFTVAAVVDAPPEEVLRLLSTPTEFPKVYSSVESVDDVEAAAPQGGLPPALTFVQRGIAYVMGRKQTPTFRLQLQADPTSGQVHYRQLAPAGMVKGMEGVNAVLPLTEDAARGDLAALLAQAADGFLASMGIGGKAAAPAQVAPVLAGPPFASLTFQLARSLRLGPQPQRARRSIVLMHSRMGLKFCPPGVSLLVKGSLLSMHLRTLTDLVARFAQPKGG